MRVVVVWVVLSLGLAALAGAHTQAPLPADLGLWFCALFGAAAAAGAATSTAVGALRRGLVVVAGSEEGLPRWGTWRRAPLPIVLGVVAAVSVFALSEGRNTSGFAVLCWSAPAAVVASRLLTRVPEKVVPIHRRRWRWLILEGAMPASIIAAGVGVIVGHVRFNAEARVPPGELARTLALTVLCYLLLAMGAFVKARHEKKSGAVIVDDDGAPPALPNPLLPGLFLAAAIAVLGPSTLPVLAGNEVFLWKGLMGFVVGGTLSLLGALAGERAASP